MPPVVRRLPGYFLRGLVLVAPLALTLYVCWKVFTTIDGWIPIDIPGLGFLATLALITIVGAFGANVLTRTLVGVLDQVLERLPFVRLLYGAAKDLLEAFVGDKKKFDTPVMVTLYPGSNAKALGFITRRDVGMLGLSEHMAVYLPQSYNFAGQLLLVPAEHVSALETSNADLMTFIVSGGVTDAPPARRTPVLGTRTSA
jgi:uncharacterized membrane protein